MDIERLKELKTNLMFEKAVSDEATRFDRDSETNRTVHQNCNDLIALIDAEIANQVIRESRTSEEVAEAIEYYRHIADITKGEESLAETSANLAITALQAYQPWTPVSERLPESDTEHQNLVLVMDSVGNYEIEMPSHIIRNIEDYTHWKPLPEPPKGE